MLLTKAVMPLQGFRLDSLLLSCLHRHSWEVPFELIQDAFSGPYRMTVLSHSCSRWQLALPRQWIGPLHL